MICCTQRWPVEPFRVKRTRCVTRSRTRRRLEKKRRSLLSCDSRHGSPLAHRSWELAGQSTEKCTVRTRESECVTHMPEGVPYRFVPVLKPHEHSSPCFTEPRVTVDTLFHALLAYQSTTNILPSSWDARPSHALAHNERCTQTPTPAASASKADVPNATLLMLQLLCA